MIEFQISKEDGVILISIEGRMPFRRGTVKQ
jgi:hypothetical protein